MASAFLNHDTTITDYFNPGPIDFHEALRLNILQV